MYEKRDGRFLVIWFCSHILAIILGIVKLFGGIPDWPWWIVLSPYIFDLVLFITVVFGICFIVFFSTIYHRDY